MLVLTSSLAADTIFARPAVESEFFNNKEDIVHIKFKYSINYEPNFAKIEFKGNLFFTLDQKSSKELLKKWKDKEISEDVKLFVFNIILIKSNIKALQLEDEFNLPPHIPLPRFSKENKESENNQK